MYLYHRIRDLIRKIRHTIVKVYKYTVFCWKENDYDFDSAYLYKIMKWKLDQMKHLVRYHGHADSNNRTVKQISYTTYLIDIILNEDFTSQKEYKHLVEKYGEPEYYFGKDRIKGYVPEELLDKGLCKSFPKVFDRDTYYICESVFYKAHDSFYEYQDMAKNRLFKHMNKYITSWWD